MPDGARRRATSHDVARAAGVSRTTVSFVLNDVSGQSIPESTRQAVFEAARRLEYTPSASARSLRTGRSRVILCVAPEWDPSALMDEALTLLSATLRAEGFAVVVAKSSALDQDDVLWSAITPAAVVAMFDLPATARARLESLHVPVVEMFLYSRQRGQLSDDLQVSVGRMQAEYLLETGCDRLVSVIPSHSALKDVVLDRVVGVRSVAEERGVPAPRVLQLEGLRSPDLLAMFNRVQASGEVVGVCCFNDGTAMAVIAAAREAGVVAPRDFRVIGVDDDPIAALTVPALTSVRLDLDALNNVVTARLRAVLGVPAGPPSPTGPFARVVVRESA